MTILGKQIAVMAGDKRARTIRCGMRFRKAAARRKNQRHHRWQDKKDNRVLLHKFDARPNHFSEAVTAITFA